MRKRGPTDFVAAVVALAVLVVGWKFELGRYIPLVNGAVRQQPLYASNDAWTAWLAPEWACPGGEDAKRAAQEQLATMLCLINYARRQQGLGTVATTTPLDVASGAKATDIVRCGRYEHAACGKAPVQVATDAGYVGSWGENLDIAEGPLGAPRIVLDSWLNSPHHRENLFRPDWRTAGLALVPDVNVEQFHDAALWVSQFGDR